MSTRRKGSRWDDDELQSCVELYLRLRQLEINGDSFKKAPECRALGERLGRDRSSVEFKMCSISYVLSLHGRYWIEGWKPRSNAGVGVAATLERLISGLGGTTIDSKVEFENRLEDELDVDVAVTLRDFPQGNARPQARETVSTNYVRDSKVVAYVIARADGICDCCNSMAPFMRVNGRPYLEVHHIVRLADGGEDTPKNAVAVCPNCHRELHYGREVFTLMKRLRDKLSTD